MMNMLSRRSRSVALLAVVLTLAAGVAEARVGGGRSSFGSRGARTYSAPPPTSTAPSPAAPIQRSQTPNVGTPAGPVAGMPSAAQPRRFGFGTGLAAGLFGAGLFGMLMGNGFFGGLAGLGSILGLLLQIGLLILLVSFVMRWFRRRQEPAYAQASQRHARTVGGPAPGGMGMSGLGGLGSVLGRGLGQNSGGAQPKAAPRSAARDEVGISERDYADFERALVEMQDAYSRNDVAKIWQMSTPEMAGYVQEELNDNAAKGVVNAVSNVRLLKGDLAEAWREGGTDYATVAMRYAMTDVTMDKATGRVVEGDPAQPVEATELWTFRRDAGGTWKLSAIQQS